MGAQWSQFFPPKPSFTEADVSSLDGKVVIITGGSSGIGFELAKILYRRNARVYIAGRSEEKAREAIRNIQASGNTGGSLEFLSLKLDDLSSINASVQEFKSKESKLHVLWNNAGVSQPPLGSKSSQGIELQFATNCLGPFLFTQLLLPLLESTAADEATPQGSVRVVWTSSQVMELSSPPDGIVIDELRTPPKDRTRNYTNSKTGNYFLATELARRARSSNIVSVSINPGAATTNLFRHTPYLKYLAYPLLYKPEFAALTELYAGLSPDIGIQNNGCYVIPWGKISNSLRRDLINAAKTAEEGGSGKAQEFWELCAEKTKAYM
ncbi:NAD(P)-binding protein [Trichoderma austrokoningii]